MSAKNNFEKDFFKLLNNSVFTKTMANFWNRVDVRLVNNEKICNKLISQAKLPQCESHHSVFSQFPNEAPKIVFYKPIYCGMAILDLSKMLMYDFH